MWISFHGLILGIEGPCLGVDHDQRIIDDCAFEYVMKDREWGVGDLAYGGAVRYTVGVKQPIGGILTPADIYFTALVAFYRARVEQVIARLKKHQWCHTPFRSSFALLCVHHNISSVMTALEIRREIEAGQPLFEVIGPWPHNI